MYMYLSKRTSSLLVARPSRSFLSPKTEHTHQKPCVPHPTLNPPSAMNPAMTPAQDLPSMPSQEVKDIAQRMAHLSALLDAAASHDQARDCRFD
jgi:hypothetical protein